MDELINNEPEVEEITRKKGDITGSFIMMGKVHIELGTECQDRATAFTTENGISLAIVSDGAGSKKFSAEGAETVVATLSKELIEKYEHILTQPDHSVIKKYLIGKIRKSVMQSPNYTDSISHFAATIVAVATYSNTAILVHQGDGIIIGVDENYESKLLSEANNEEYANVTYFFSDADAHERLRVQTVFNSSYKGFLVCSDGVADSLYNAKTEKFSTAIKSLFTKANELGSVAFNEYLQVQVAPDFVENSTDDCSLAMLLLKTDDVKNVLQTQESN